jgi:integrase
MIMADWCARWVATTLEASARRATTKATYATLVRRHILPAMGEKRLKEISAADVERLVLDVRARLAPSTTRQVHMVLVMVLDSAVKHGLLRRNVAKLVDRPVRPTKEAHYFTPDVVTALRNGAAGHRLEPFLTLIAFTGLRKGEALALRWTDVDLEGDVPTLKVTGTLSRVGADLLRSEPKTASGRRVVPLVPQGVAALERARKRQREERLKAGDLWVDSGYVFTTALGTPVDPRNALRWFYDLRKKAGQETGSIHSLRHSVASVLLAANVPMPVVRDVLGHASIEVTVDLYGHMSPTTIAAEMARGMTALDQVG